MKNSKVLTHKFVEYIPEKLEDNIVYVSVEYATAAHKCCCGCGNEVITPFSPTDWNITFNGESVSLHPSIGNWNFSCQSHYWIKNNAVIWAGRMSKNEINAGRLQDQILKGKYYYGEGSRERLTAAESHQGASTSKKGFWSWLKAWLS